jgi:hypothetical protein
MATAVAIPDVDDALKLQFAAVYVRENKNAAAAALAIFPDNAGRALLYSHTLPNDPVVKSEIARLVEDVDPKLLMPTKYEQARDIYARAQKTEDNEEYVKLMRLYADIMGFVEKPGANVDVNVQVANVMVVPNHGSDDDWQKKTRAQQERLTLNAD